MSDTLAPAPAPAAWTFSELTVAPRIINRWLLAALALSVLGNIGQAVQNDRLNTTIANWKPIFIRITETYRAEAIDYKAATTWAPTEVELTHVTRNLLTSFVQMHYRRLRSTVARDFGNSLLFLRDDLTDALFRPGEPNPAEVFVRDLAAPEVDIEVSTVTFPNLTKPPYQATVDFREVTYVNGGRGQKQSRRMTAQIVFTVPNAVPFSVVPVNPLGLRILNLRVDPAFTE
jgi:hypothetical protein